MPKIILKGYIIIPETVSEINRQAILDELENHKQLTLAEIGCLTFEVTHCLEDNSKFTVYEEFINRDAFNAHQHRVKNSEWGRVSIDVERHYQIESQTAYEVK